MAIIVFHTVWKQLYVIANLEVGSIDEVEEKWVQLRRSKKILWKRFQKNVLKLLYYVRVKNIVGNVVSKNVQMKMKMFDRKKDQNWIMSLAFLKMFFAVKIINLSLKAAIMRSVTLAL